MIEVVSLSIYTVDEKKHHSTKWMDTQEWYKFHKVRHIARYYPSTAPVESTAPTETAGAAASTIITTTLIENYWMIVTNGESPSKES